jgi:hypothetical protein
VVGKTSNRGPNIEKESVWGVVFRATRGLSRLWAKFIAASDVGAVSSTAPYGEGGSGAAVSAQFIAASGVGAVSSTAPSGEGGSASFPATAAASGPTGAAVSAEFAGEVPFSACDALADEEDIREHAVSINIPLRPVVWKLPHLL